MPFSTAITFLSLRMVKLRAKKLQCRYFGTVWDKVLTACLRFEVRWEHSSEFDISVMNY